MKPRTVGLAAALAFAFSAAMVLIMMAKKPAEPTPAPAPPTFADQVTEVCDAPFANGQRVCCYSHRDRAGAGLSCLVVPQ